MKKVILLLFLCGRIWAQSTLVTGQVTDPDAQTWNNGTYTINFVPTPGIPGPFSWNGVQNFPVNYTGSLDASGNISITIPDNNFIKPLGTKWRFTLCSNTSAPCQDVVTPVSGSSINLGSTFSNNIVAPRFGAGQFSHGYLDIEVTGTIPPGSTYFNVSTNFLRVWNGTIWSNLTGSGGSPPAGKASQTQYNLGGGAFGAQVGTSYFPGTGNIPGKSVIDNQSSVVTVSADYNFTACASGCPSVTSGLTTISVGANTVTLTPVPVGVNGTDARHYIEIDPGAGDPTPVTEWVLITGGTAASGAATGTLTFTAAYAHTAGYTIASATTGIQEAAITLQGISANGPGVKLKLDTGINYRCNAPIYLPTGSFELDGQGATISHSSFSTCLTLGAGPFMNISNSGEGGHIHDLLMLPNRAATWSVNPVGSIAQNSNNITVTIPTCPAGFFANIPGQLLWVAGTASGRPTTAFGYGEFALTTGGTCVPGGTSGTVTLAAADPSLLEFAAHDHGYSLSNNVGPYIEDTVSNNGHISDIRFLSFAGVAGSLFQNDGDQSFSVENINTGGTTTRGDADFQGAGVFSPGPFGTLAAISYLGPNVNFTNLPRCVQTFSGNDFSWTEGICQGYLAGGVFVGVKRGGFGHFSIGPNVHFEPGSISPLWGAPVGNPWVMVMGGTPTSAPLFNINQGILGMSNSIGSPYPVFALLSSQTNTQYYYLVAHNNVLTGCTSGGDCVSPPMFIGAAQVTDPSVNNVTVTFLGWGAGYLVSGADPNPSSYDLLAVSSGNGSLNQAIPAAPIGTSTYAVTTGLSPATICSIHNLCTITDNVAPGSRASYTVVSSQTSNKRFFPVAIQMPGQVAISGAGDVNETVVFSQYTGYNVCLNDMQFFGSVYTGQMFTAPLGCPNEIAPVAYGPSQQQCFSTTGNCPATGAGGAGAGSVTIAAGATTVTVTTTAVTPWSVIQAWEDSTQGTNLGVTCNTTLGRTYGVTLTTGGFIITASGAPTTNPACIDFRVGNPN